MDPSRSRFTGAQITAMVVAISLAVQPVSPNGTTGTSFISVTGFFV